MKDGFQNKKNRLVKTGRKAACYWHAIFWMVYIKQRWSASFQSIPPSLIIEESYLQTFLHTLKCSFLFHTISKFLFSFSVPKICCRISKGSQTNCYQNMKHNTNTKKHITMLCIAKNGRHCQKADYNRNGCRNQRCHPKIFSFPLNL